MSISNMDYRSAVESSADDPSFAMNVQSKASILLHTMKKEIDVKYPGFQPSVSIKNSKETLVPLHVTGLESIIRFTKLWCAWGS